MLRLFDKHNRDITGETEYCGHPACLGEPWCSAWGICKTAQEPQQRASTSQMQQATPSTSTQQVTPSGLLGEEDIDQLLHELSQQLDSTKYTQLPLSSFPLTFLSQVWRLCQKSTPAPPHWHPCKVSSLLPHPVSLGLLYAAQQVLEARDKGVPEKTRKDTLYCCRVWEAWRDNRNSTGSNIPQLLEMDKKTQVHWLTRFVLKMRKVDGSEYPPNTLYHIVCGIMRYVRGSIPEIDFFKDAEFKSFVASLNAEMKRLQSNGTGSTHKQAAVEEEELMWESKVLGDHCSQSLLNTMIYMNGLYFALRSGEEHRSLRRSSCQIEVVERPGERAYLVHREDIAKNHPGGLKGRKVKPKTSCKCRKSSSVFCSSLQTVSICVSV